MTEETELYRKVGDFEIIVNTIPKQTQQTAYVWVGDTHSFELKVGEVKNGCFALSIFPELITAVKLDIAITMIHESQNKEWKKIKDTYPSFKTRDTFEISESEQENYELAYEMIVHSINNFNTALRSLNTIFTEGRYYQTPSFEDCLIKIREGYSKIS